MHRDGTPFSPEETDLLGLLGRWASDPAIREGILVRNPAALYGF